MLDAAVHRIKEATDLEPRVGVVLGSGLGGLADVLENRVEIPYGEIPGWPVSTAVGHAGVLVLGEVDGGPDRGDARTRPSLRGCERRPGGVRGSRSR